MPSAFCFLSAAGGAQQTPAGVGDHRQLDLSMAFGRMCGTGGQVTNKLRVLTIERLHHESQGSGWEGKWVQTEGLVGEENVGESAGGVE